MFKSNAKYYIKQSISPTAGVGDTFNISTDFELGLDLETGTDTVSVLLTSGTQIERMTITATGGVVTIVQRGLTQADTKVEDTNLNKQWNDGAIMVITAFASDLPDLDKSSGINIFTSDIGVSDGKKIYVGNNAYLTTTNNGTDLEFKDGNNALTTLSELTSGAGTDHKVLISATDTTAGFLDSKLTAGDGLSKTLVNGGDNESIDLDIDLTDTTIFSDTAGKVGILGPDATYNRLVKATTKTFVAGEDITSGNALYVHTDGKVYKADASDSYKINFKGFATNTATTGNNVIVDTSGVSDTQSGLTIGSDYFLSNTPGAISTTPGTNPYLVGNSVSDNGIEIQNQDLLYYIHGDGFISSDNIKCTSVSEKTDSGDDGNTSGHITKMKEITMPNIFRKGGSLKVKYEGKTGGTSGEVMYVGFKVNGSPVGSIQSISSGTYSEYNQTLSSISEGSTIELWISLVDTDGSSVTGYIRNFSVCYDIVRYNILPTITLN